MGQAVNAKGFRLGWNGRWNAGYFPVKEERAYLFQQQMYVKRVVIGLFMHHGLPFYGFNKTRNKRDEQENIRSFGEKSIVKNPFYKQGMFYFDHRFSLGTDKAIINVFFIDQALQNIKKHNRVKRKKKALDMFYLEGRKKKDFRPFRLFSHYLGKGRKGGLREKLVKKLKGMAKRRPRRRTYRNYKLRRITRTSKKTPFPSGVLDLLFLQRSATIWSPKENYPKKFSLTPKLIYPFAMGMVNTRMDKESFFQAEILSRLTLRILQLLKVLRKFKKKALKNKKKSNVKMKIKDKGVKSNVKMKIKDKGVKSKLLMANRRMKIGLLKLFVLSRLHSLRYFPTRFHLQNITGQLRSPIFREAGKIMALQLLHHTALPYNRLETLFTGTHDKHVNPQMLVRIIERRLGEYIPISPVLGEVRAKLRSATREVRGYRILVTGRLTRKERAAVILKSKGPAKMSTVESPIEYASGFKIMKFGLVGIKIWITRRTAKKSPYLYLIGITYSKPSNSLLTTKLLSSKKHATKNK